MWGVLFGPHSILLAQPLHLSSGPCWGWVGLAMPLASLGPALAAPVGSAVAGNIIQLPVCSKCLLQSSRHCPTLPWPKWLTATQYDRAHLSSTLSVPVIELAVSGAISLDPPNNPEK